MQTVPLSRSGHEEIPEVKKRKLELPPSEVRCKAKEREQRKDKQKAEKKERKRIKAEAKEVHSFLTLRRRIPSHVRMTTPLQPRSRRPMVQAVLNQHVKMLNGRSAVTTRTSTTGMITAIGLVTSLTGILGSGKRSGSGRRQKVRIAVLDVRKGRMKDATTDESDEPEKESSGPKSSEHERPVDEENADYDAEPEASEDNEQTRRVRGFLGSFVPRAEC